MTIGKELWFQYLESRLLIFGRGASILNRFRRDKEMTKSIRSDGFSGKSERDYNQRLYETYTDKCADSVYSQGFDFLLL